VRHGVTHLSTSTTHLSRRDRTGRDAALPSGGNPQHRSQRLQRDMSLRSTEGPRRSQSVRLKHVKSRSSTEDFATNVQPAFVPRLGLSQLYWQMLCLAIKHYIHPPESVRHMGQATTIPPWWRIRPVKRSTVPWCWCYRTTRARPRRRCSGPRQSLAYMLFGAPACRGMACRCGG